MPDDQAIRVTSETIDGAVVVSPEGDVDLAGSPVLRTTLKQAHGAKPKRLIIDLASVDYMDSSGVATLVEALQMSRKNGTKMVLCSMKDRVRSIFEIARLDTVFSIVPSRDDALKA